jgi:enediyne biosynthesis thioesterase
VPKKPANSKMDTPKQTQPDKKALAQTNSLKETLQKQGIAFSAPQDLNLSVSFQNFHPKKTYTCKIETFLKDSNAYGNIYFSRFFEWQGIVREKFWRECIADDMLASDLLLTTKSASIEYIQEVYPFEEILLELNTFDLKNTFLKIRTAFRSIPSKTLVATGDQTIVFRSIYSRKIIRIPEDVKQKLKIFSI